MPMSTAASRSDEAAEIAGSASIWKLLNICRGKVALSRPEMKETLGKQMMIVAVSASPEEFTEQVRAETRAWAQVVRANKIELH